MACSTCGSERPYEAGVPCQECFITERTAQGLPPTIEDPELIQKFAEVLGIADPIQRPDVAEAPAGDLRQFDIVTVPDWPDDRWELVTRVDELAPGFVDVETKGGQRYTWAAERPVQVRLPRPGGQAKPETRSAPT